MTAPLILLALAGASLGPPAPDTYAPPVAAAPATVSPAAVGTAILSWAGTVHMEIESAPDEVVVRFDRPLTDEAIAKFGSLAGSNLADLRWNDTSLVLRPANGWRISAVPHDRGLEVQFAPDDREAAQSVDALDADTPPPSNPAIELALVRAQADAAAGYPGKARRSLASLGQRYPGAVQVQRALADAEMADGAIVTAAERYRSLGAEDPLARRAMAEANGKLASALSIRSGKTFNQKEASLVQSSFPISTGLSIGAGIRRVATRSDFVAAPPGEATKVNSKMTIADVTANITLGPAARLLLQGSALIGEQAAGVGARLALGSQERQLRVGLAYRVPDLSTAEQSAFGGHISRAALGGTLRLTPELLGQADLGWNGYGLAGAGILTKTFVANGGLDFLVRRSSPSVAITYRLDAEYVAFQKMRANGLAFIPLSDRENHSVQLVSSVRWHNTQLTGALGWTKDRKGRSDGPTADLGAAMRIGDAWTMEANGGISSVSRPAVSGRQLYLRLSLSRYLKWRP